MKFWLFITNNVYCFILSSISFWSFSWLKHTASSFTRLVISNHMLHDCCGNTHIYPHKNTNIKCSNLEGNSMKIIPKHFLGIELQQNYPKDVKFLWQNQLLLQLQGVSKLHRGKKRKTKQRPINSQLLVFGFLFVRTPSNFLCFDMLSILLIFPLLCKTIISGTASLPS